MKDVSGRTLHIGDWVYYVGNHGQLLPGRIRQLEGSVIVIMNSDKSTATQFSVTSEFEHVVAVTRDSIRADIVTTLETIELPREVELPESETVIMNKLIGIFTEELPKSIIRKQTRKGYEKYGSFLDHNDRPLSSRLLHCLEEAIDLAQYLEWVEQAFEQKGSSSFWKGEIFCSNFDIRRSAIHNLVDWYSNLHTLAIFEETGVLTKLYQ